jgi:transcriptional regulator with XRE-family HTH domain
MDKEYIRIRNPIPMNGLKKLRTQMGITQQSMCELLGIPKQQLSLFELGLRSMPLSAFYKMNNLQLAFLSAETVTDTTVTASLQLFEQEKTKKLRQLLADVTVQQMAVQRRLVKMQQAYPKAMKTIQTAGLLLQQPATLQDRTFQLSLEIVRDDALKKAKACHPLVQSELQIRLAVLQLQQTLLQQQLDAANTGG